MTGYERPAHTFVLIRHAQAYCNLEPPGKLVEDYDPGSALTPKGVAQAAALAAALPEAMIGMQLFASPLARACSTAEPLARRFGRPIVRDARLAEVRVDGRFAPPLTLADWDALLWARLQTPDAAVHPQIEPLYEQAARVGEFLEDRHRTRGADTVTTVVAHAFTIELAILHLLGLELSALTRIRIRASNACIHAVENDAIGAPARLVLSNARPYPGNFERSDR